jgi:predicted enzyme related to lactoylglutathione lyase
MRKSTMLLLCLLNIIFLWAQDKNEFNFSFNHMALSVKELDVSVEFYKKVFQLAEIKNRSAIEGIRWLSAGEDKELHLISIMKEPVKINKAVHLAFTTRTFDAFALHHSKPEN